MSNHNDTTQSGLFPYIPPETGYSEVFYSGGIAYRNGVSFADNPYDQFEETQYHLDWSNGWDRELIKDRKAFIIQSIL